MEKTGEYSDKSAWGFGESGDCVDLVGSRWRGKPVSRTSRQPPWLSGFQSGPGRDQQRVWEVCPPHLSGWPWRRDLEAR